MFEIGSSLREARVRRGLSPADVYRAIRIRERYLTALEDERWAMLPGDAYAKGFLRTYADFLGLRGQLYVDEYNARISQSDDEPLAALPPARRRGRIPVRAIVVIVVVAAASVAVVAWRHGGSRPKLETAAAPPRVVHHTKRRVTKPAVAPKPTFAVVRAVRDISWLSVRVGGPSGREIYRGTLQLGHSLRLGLARGIWLRMGRPQALDITVGGRLVRNLPSEPANLRLTR